MMALKNKVIKNVNEISEGDAQVKGFHLGTLKAVFLIFIFGD